MTREDARAALQAVTSAMHEQFPGALARLEQLDAHAATVDMVVQLIYDEADQPASKGN